MKRRTFVLLSLYSTAAISLPFDGCNNKNGLAGKSWAVPELLSHICDEKTLHEIGDAYRKKVLAENGEKQLTNLLLTDSTNTIIPVSSGDVLINSMLERKIQKDFESGRIVIVQGWVLSETEARQCALFSLIQK